MPEAVVATAVRTSIGRAGRGSLTRWRPDDLAALTSSAAVRALDPAGVDDVMPGCGLPGGGSGKTMGGGQDMALVLDRI